MQRIRSQFLVPVNCWCDPLPLAILQTNPVPTYRRRGYLCRKQDGPSCKCPQVCRSHSSLDFHLGRTDPEHEPWGRHKTAAWGHGQWGADITPCADSGGLTDSCAEVVVSFTRHGHAGCQWSKSSVCKSVKMPVKTTARACLCPVARLPSC